MRKFRTFQAGSNSEIPHYPPGKRHGEGMENLPDLEPAVATDRGGDTVEESLPQREDRGPQATDLADIQETLPESSRPQATDEPGEKFGRGKVVESLPQPNGVAPKSRTPESLAEPSLTLRKVCLRVHRFRKICLNRNLGKICPRFPARIAVDYERVFAEQAKKRQGQRTDLADIPETLPECSPRENESAEQAGDLFNVSGRTVRDAHKAPYWGLDRSLSDFHTKRWFGYG